MEKMTYSKYYLIKAVLVSNLEEGVKEALVNSLVNSWQSQPAVWYGNLTTTTDNAIRNPNITYFSGD